MSQTRQTLSTLLQADVELRFLVSTFYTNGQLKDLDNETLALRGDQLADQLCQFSLAWSALSAMHVTIKEEAIGLQQEIKSHLPGLKETCDKVKVLTADIDKLHLLKETRENFKMNHEGGVPLIYDFMAINLPPLASQVLVGRSMLFGCYNSTRKLKHQIELMKPIFSDSQESHSNEEDCALSPSP